VVTAGTVRPAVWLEQVRPAVWLQQVLYDQLCGYSRYNPLCNTYRQFRLLWWIKSVWFSVGLSDGRSFLHSQWMWKNW